MQRINVSGGWIDLRDPKDVPEKLRRPVIEKSVSLQEVVGKEENDLTSGDLSNLFGLNDLIAVALVAGWSFAHPITLDGLLELSGSAYDDILKAVAPKTIELMPNFGVDPDPKVPIENSDDSLGS
jgi:hypothetical protein